MPAKKKDAQPASQAMTASEQLDKKLAAEAMRKVMQGQTPSTREKSALRKYEKQREEHARWQYYRSIPQKHWREMSGRQSKVINEQAQRYGIPFGGKTINLPEVVRAMHNFLAENAQRLSAETDPMLVDIASPALERYREERAALARLDRLERERSVVSRTELRDGLTRIATILRGAGETLQRQFGPQALEVLHEALDDADQEVRRLFAETEADDQFATARAG